MGLILILAALLGQSDDSAALNTLIRAGGTVALEPRVYGISAPIDGTAPNITIRGVPGATKLVKLPLPSGDGITSLGGSHTYRGWTFEGIEFDGNGRAIEEADVPYYYTLPFGGSRSLRFVRCTFRDLLRGVILRDSEDIAFDDCTFLGTRPGVFAAGTWEPPAVAGATLTGGLEVWPQVRGLRVSRCRFRYCSDGLSVITNATQSVDGLTVEGCDFTADWWDTPGATLRFTADKYEGGRLVVPGGGLSKAFGRNQVVSFRRDLATGSKFTRIYAGAVTGDRPFDQAAPGDVIETEDGRRARIGAVESANLVNVEGWEAMADYAPTDPPPSATAWRLVRYYACGTMPVSDTVIQLYFEPVNPVSGERAVSDAKLDLTKLPARALAKTNYSGLHVNGGVRGLLVSGNTFRGGWADQCSVFDLPEPCRILGNRFAYGQDEAITLTRCVGAVVEGNTFENSGVSAVFLGGSDGTKIVGNSVRNWGVVNPHVGAIDGNGREMVIHGNTFAVAATDGREWSRWAVRLYAGDCTGTVIAGNTGSGTEATVNVVDRIAAPNRNAFTVRDAAIVGGSGKVNVKVVP